MNSTINCIIVDDEAVAREIIEQLVKDIPGIRIIASCKNALEAFKVINSEDIHLIFLDINMPEISGLSLAKSINKNIKIIFTTAYREYAVDGFDLQAVDYLLKPISFERLVQAINKFKKETQKVNTELSPKHVVESSEGIFVRSDRKMVRVNFSDIHYIESIGDYIKIHLQAKSIVTRETLAEFEASLPEGKFLRIHRSYIVAISEIQSYTNEYVEFGKIQLPISRSHRALVIEFLGTNDL